MTSGSDPPLYPQSSSSHSNIFCQQGTLVFLLMSDFYLNLPSTVKGRGNINSDYTTRLPEPLTFRSKWSVGLCELLISGQIRTVPRHTPFVITLKDGSIVNCILPRGNYKSPQLLARALNDAIPGLRKRRFARSVQGERNVEKGNDGAEEEEEEEEEEPLNVSPEELAIIQAAYLQKYGQKLVAKSDLPAPPLSGSDPKQRSAPTPTPSLPVQSTPVVTVTPTPTTVPQTKPAVTVTPAPTTVTPAKPATAAIVPPPPSDSAKEVEAQKVKDAEKRKRDEEEKLKIKKKHEAKLKAEKEEKEAEERKERKRIKDEEEAQRERDRVAEETRQRRVNEEKEKKRREEEERIRKEDEDRAEKERAAIEEKELNERLKSAITENTIEPILTVDNLEEQFQEGQFRAGKPLDTHAIFEYDEVAARIVVDLRHTVAKLELHKEISYMLGFNSQTLHVSSVADSPPDVTNGKGLLMVYSDLASHSIVGDQKANLLRIVPCLNSSNETISHSFTQIRYVPLISDYIDSVRIQILDSLGNDVVVEGFVSAVLHLKRE